MTSNQDDVIKPSKQGGRLGAFLRLFAVSPTINLLTGGFSTVQGERRELAFGRIDDADPNRPVAPTGCPGSLLRLCLFCEQPQHMRGRHGAPHKVGRWTGGPAPPAPLPTASNRAGKAYQHVGNIPEAKRTNDHRGGAGGSKNRVQGRRCACRSGERDEHRGRRSIRRALTIQRIESGSGEQVGGTISTLLRGPNPPSVPLLRGPFESVALRRSVADLAWCP